MTIESEIRNAPPNRYEYHYQGIEQVIRFLLGHRPFQHNFVYAPTRVYNDLGKRVDSKLHTADWWWDLQIKLPLGATVVPLLVGIDKTILTQHQGDLASWPIYLTIGNLDSRTRRQQGRPALILIGFMPMLAGVDRVTKAKVYHMVLHKIFQSGC